MSFWYVIKVVPGKEKQLCEDFNKEIKSGKIKNIVRFLSPMEDVVVNVKKKKIHKDKPLYSGYLYFESNNKLSENELKFISTRQSILGMFGNRIPLLLSQSDVKKILKDDELKEHNDLKNIKFNIGEEVLITDGPFNDFRGIIVNIDGETVKLEVKIFGRATNIELNIEQIKKT